MHEYLRSIGFSGKLSRKDLKELVDWVIEKPDHMTICAVDEDVTIAEASREIGGHAGIRVVGEIDETGRVIPEYYFPYVESDMISSDAQISVEKQTDRNGYIGMCEDYRLGMALIFSVANVADVARHDADLNRNATFSKVSLNLLASDGVVLLPLEMSEKVIAKRNDEREQRKKLIQEAHQGNSAAIDAITRNEVHHFHHIMERLHRTDVYTVVESFFMPHGMESERYYLMGRIASCMRIVNELTGEAFYRMNVEVNDMNVCVAIAENDLYGEPHAGDRLKCHVWSLGELR